MNHKHVLLANLKAILRTRKLLMDLETDLGILNWSPAERDALYSIGFATSKVEQTVPKQALLAYKPITEYSFATHARAMNSVQKRGYISVHGRPQTALYSLTHPYDRIPENPSHTNKLVTQLKPMTLIRNMLHEMECDLGVMSLPLKDRLYLCAAIESINSPDDIIYTKNTLNSKFLKGFSVPTIYRSLNRMLEIEILQRSEVGVQGAYIMGSLDHFCKDIEGQFKS